MNAIKNEYPDWWEVLTTEQINGFLQEDFLQKFNGDVNLPDGFHDLRVQIEEGKIRLGIRYGTGFWSTILSIDLKVWLIANEVNLMPCKSTTFVRVVYRFRDKSLSTISPKRPAPITWT